MFESVSGLTPFSLLDYPGNTCCILWFGGCNLRCPYCHNPELVRPPFARFGASKVATFLESRRGLLDGVCLSGGESSLSPEIGAICQSLKDWGFRVKVDTNGCRPNTLRALIDAELIDYVALDYKAPKEKFEATTGRNYYYDFSESLDILIQSGLEREIRTTVLSRLLDERDIDAIILDLESRGYRNRYYVQNFADHGTGKRTLSALPSHIPLDRKRIGSSDLIDVLYRNFD